MKMWEKQKQTNLFWPRKDKGGRKENNSYLNPTIQKLLQPSNKKI